MEKIMLGKKVGMTQIFDSEGKMVPVTVVEAGPCTIIQIKDSNNDGYEAIQIGYGSIKDKNVTNPLKGHFAKANVKPLRYLREFRVENSAEYSAGQEIKVDVFEEGELIDVSGVTKGKGFQGSIKRHNFSRGPMAHGSRYHRRTGSLGALGPNRVFKGKKLPGHMGRDKVTIQNLEVLKVVPEQNLILVKGSIPGAKKSFVSIKKAVKSN